MWQSVRIEPTVSGCPNRCRHCAEDAAPPYGELMPLDDLRWAVDGLARACRATLGDACRVRVSEEGFEPTAHPRFLEVLAYCRASIPTGRRDEFTALSTNGYGLADHHWREG